MGRENDYSGEWYLPVGNGDAHLYVLERGTGPIVLAVHGGPGHDHGYLLDALAPLEDHHRVVYFDQRGSLRSPTPVGLVSFDAVVDDIAALVEELGRPVAAVAHSMGCVILAAALARHSGLFAEVLLVCPGPLRASQPWPAAPSPRPEVDVELARRGIGGQPLSPKEQTWEWRIRFAGVNLFHVDRWSSMAGGKVFYNHEVGNAVRSGIPPDHDYVHALQAHPRQVVVAVGDHDFVDPGGRHAQTIVGGAVRATVVAEAGHNLWVDQPEQFAHVLREVFDSSELG